MIDIILILIANLILFKVSVKIDAEYAGTQGIVGNLFILWNLVLFLAGLSVVIPMLVRYIISLF